MTKLKICGLTTQDDVSFIENHADALGFIFYSKSPRFVSPQHVASITTKPFVKRVGVFVNASKDDICHTFDVSKLDVVQCHGDESPEFCRELGVPVIKAIRVSNEDDIRTIEQFVPVVDAILLDTKVDGLFGGTGKTFDWAIASKVVEMGVPVILSGGLGPDNISSAIQLTAPYAVDVSSGVELSPGHKDHEKLKEVFKHVKGYH